MCNIIRTTIDRFFNDGDLLSEHLLNPGVEIVIYRLVLYDLKSILVNKQKALKCPNTCKSDHILLHFAYGNWSRRGSQFHCLYRASHLHLAINNLA